jgi:hypothetical protein
MKRMVEHEKDNVRAKVVEQQVNGAPKIFTQVNEGTSDQVHTP